ncbi:sensor histidine kinase [Xylella taiwanensis]|nr:sensor histidine kinase [Xylella taiwanensis]AXI83417.1 histidine kinase [Xylella taiwanensis]MCD8456487.1 sensor histidine kinase [Xylella taiwanensis]MCD8458894.1 sensor histidine kinase [Xylella taiwanensis]MCD8461031.1 sensor histidine kinase [Xylella taiwanensis]MCD8462908.1 sensor histidine kinase [Xylella taiwanensis]
MCRVPRIVALLGLAELVVVVAMLVPDQRSVWSVSRFLSASGMAMWLALAIGVLLCVLRPFLLRLPPMLGKVAVLMVASTVAMLGTGVVHVLYVSLGQPPIAPEIGFWRYTLGCSAITVLITGLALHYFYVSDRWVAQLQAQARAQVDALQARIRPHFLFNSMNLIASLLRRDPEIAEQAVLDLSDLFRAALEAGGDESNLREECELAERYLAIESLRLGDRLQVRWKRVEPLPWQLPLPRLVLQPLLENAILHGISQLPAGGCVEVSLCCEVQRLYIRIVNPAPSPQKLAAGAGHAQASIAHRLGYRFGPAARMTAVWSGGYYACDIVLPLT